MINFDNKDKKIDNYLNFEEEKDLNHEYYTEKDFYGDYATEYLERYFCYEYYFYDDYATEYLERYPCSDYYFNENEDIDLEKCIPMCQIRKKLLSLGKRLMKR